MKCGVNVRGDMNAEGVQLSIIMLYGYSTVNIQLLRSCTLLVRIPRVSPTVIHIFLLSGKFYLSI